MHEAGGEPPEAERDQPLDEARDLRLEEARWWIANAREVLQNGGRRYQAREVCPDCGTKEAALVPRNGQNVVKCIYCGRHLYNAPKTETGETPRTVATVRQHVKPGKQARLFDRDHCRCVLCGRGTNEVQLTIGHLLSIDDGVALGATEHELNDDANLATMCEACNLGLGGRSVSPATYARIMLHLVRVASPQRVPTAQRDLDRDLVRAQRPIAD